MKVIYFQGGKLEALLRALSPLKDRLKSRVKMAPADFESTLKQREEGSHKAPWVPVGKVDAFFPGTYYLVEIDDKRRRRYERVQPSR